MEKGSHLALHSSNSSLVWYFPLSPAPAAPCLRVLDSAWQCLCPPWDRYLSWHKERALCHGKPCGASHSAALLSTGHCDTQHGPVHPLGCPSRPVVWAATVCCPCCWQHPAGSDQPRLQSHTAPAGWSSGGACLALTWSQQDGALPFLTRVTLSDLSILSTGGRTKSWSGAQDQFWFVFQTLPCWCKHLLPLVVTAEEVLLPTQPGKLSTLQLSVPLPAAKQRQELQQIFTIIC